MQLGAGKRVEDLPALHARAGAEPDTPERWRERADGLKTTLLAHRAE